MSTAVAPSAWCVQEPQKNIKPNLLCVIKTDIISVNRVDVHYWRLFMPCLEPLHGIGIIGTNGELFIWLSFETRGLHRPPSLDSQRASSRRGRALCNTEEPAPSLEEAPT